MPARRVMRIAPVALRAAAAAAPLSDLRDEKPGEERDYGQEIRGVDEPVSGVREVHRLRCSQAQALACDSSHSARLVNPTMTASIQYWERTASLARSYIASARSCASVSAATCPTTTNPTCQYQVALAPITV